MNKKVILYELNEVPKKIVDFFISKEKNSALCSLISEGIYLETRTIDEGELHPWTTWPTLHRGVSNQLHGIKYINQDLKEASKFPPVWEILANNNIKAGLFGSLHPTLQ